MEERKWEGRTERRNKQHKTSRWCLIISVKMNKHHQKWRVGRISNCPYTQLVLQLYVTSKGDESET
jgi:hypothetical protein